MEITRTNKLIGSYEDFIQYSDTYCESGSCMGSSIELALKAGFKTIKSVEAKDNFYQYCKEKFKDNPNVHLYHGISTDKWDKMLKGLGKCVLLLDAHPSGAASFGHDDLMLRGDKSEFYQDNIIKKELEIILAHRNDHVIIIDDQNLDEKGNAVSYNKFIRQMLAANPKYKFYGYDEQRGTHFYKNKFLVAIPDDNV